jgi:hypothetical protein
MAYAAQTVADHAALVKVRNPENGLEIKAGHNSKTSA